MGMKKTAPSLSVLAFLVLSSALNTSGQDARTSGPIFEVQDYRLRNGLRVILSEDGSLPLVTVVVAFGAGTIREEPGQEGLAYLLENLMFQGSENVSPLQHVGFIQKVGGELNATTTLDKSLFYETFPSNYLALALWLESDRMKSLAITAAAIEKTRADILKEHQARLVSDPYLASFARFDALLFPDFPYGHPLIGSGAEMRGFTEGDVLAFHQKFYVPNNAVLCIVGDIDLAKTRDLVARYFDSIPPGYDAPMPPPPVFRQDGEVAQSLSGVQAASAGFHLGYRFYPLQTGDASALKILEYLLFKGETSRLRNRLLRRDLTAHYLSGALEDRRGVLALKVFCLNNNAVMAQRSQKAIASEFEKLRVNPVSADELAKAKHQFKMDYLRRLSTRLGRAFFLIDTAFSGRPLDATGAELEGCLRVSSTALTSLVGRHIVPRNKVVLELEQR
jgi:predicted Zn-dependent peptidase